MLLPTPIRWVLIAVLALLTATAARAADEPTLVGKTDDFTVTLTHEACANPSVVMLLVMGGENPADYRAGSVVLKSGPRELCWAPVEDRIFVVDEAGAMGGLSRELFGGKPPVKGTGI